MKFRSWKTWKSHGKGHGKSWNFKAEKSMNPVVGIKNGIFYESKKAWATAKSVSFRGLLSLSFGTSTTPSPLSPRPLSPAPRTVTNDKDFPIYCCVATTWQGGHVGGQNIKKSFCRICMIRDRPLFFWRGGMKNIEKKMFTGPKKTK